MNNLKAITDTKHQELLALLNPLVDFMIENKFNYFLVAGKDGVCTRHLRGQLDDVSGMITGFAENHNQIREILEDSVKNL